jgi:YidC/Oxa1 family membrane protein insertase
MDRRTLLALVLSAMVIVIWTGLFAPSREPASDGDVPGGTPSTGQTAAPTPPDAGTPSPTPTEPAGPGSAGEEPGATEGRAAIGATEAAPASQWREVPEATVVVETDLTRLEIATHGGVLTSVELLDFASGTNRQERVDLIRPGHQALDATLVWRDPTTGGVVRSEPLHRVGFEVVADRPGDEPGGREVILRAERGDGLRVERRYVLRDGSYVIDHSVHVRAPSGGGVARPDVVVLGWRSGIAFTERAESVDQGHMNGLAMVGEELHEWKPGSFKKNGPKSVDGNVRWLGVRNKYFISVIIPEPGTAVSVHADGDPTSSRNAVWVDLPISSATAFAARVQVYAGPSDFSRLQALGNDLEKAVRLGWSWIRPVSKLMLAAINGAYRLVPNYGVVIILITIVIRLLMHPLNRTSMRSMKAMQAVQPEMEALRKKYANDPQALNKRMMELYKARGVNPLGGCLPMVLQMPVLFALYSVLMFSVDLRLAPFVGWIDDLSAPDTIGKILGFELHVLPLVMTAVSILQTRATPKDPRQAMMTQMMPVIFLFLFYSMPSGLVLYWTVMTLMGWIQQALMNREDGAAVAPTAAGAAAVTAQGAKDVTAAVSGAVRDTAVPATEAAQSNAERRDGDEAKAARGSKNGERMAVAGQSGGRSRRQKRRKR